MNNCGCNFIQFLFYHILVLNMVRSCGLSNDKDVLWEVGQQPLSEVKEVFSLFPADKTFANIEHLETKTAFLL